MAEIKKIVLVLRNNIKTSSICNIRYDPDLAVGKAADRRILCTCNSCIKELEL